MPIHLNDPSSPKGMSRTAKLFDWEYNAVADIRLPDYKGLPEIIWYRAKAYSYYVHTVQLDADGQPPVESEPPYREIPGFLVSQKFEALKPSSWVWIVGEKE